MDFRLPPYCSCLKVIESACWLLCGGFPYFAGFVDEEFFSFFHDEGVSVAERFCAIPFQRDGDLAGFVNETALLVLLNHGRPLLKSLALTHSTGMTTLPFLSIKPYLSSFSTLARPSLNSAIVSYVGGRMTLSLSLSSFRP